MPGVGIVQAHELPFGWEGSWARWRAPTGAAGPRFDGSASAVFLAYGAELTGARAAWRASARAHAGDHHARRALWSEQRRRAQQAASAAAAVALLRAGRDASSSLIAGAQRFAQPPVAAQLGWFVPAQAVGGALGATRARNEGGLGVHGGPQAAVAFQWAGSPPPRTAYAHTPTRHFAPAPRSHLRAATDPRARKPTSPHFTFASSLAGNAAARASPAPEHWHGAAYWRARYLFELQRH